MAKKMYYSELEAAAKLGKTVADIDGLVRQGKLRTFQDGGRRMFRADEIDALSAQGPKDQIDLAPAEAESGAGINLADTDQTGKPKGKEDTVITSQGISIFDDEDLEIEEADPMAKTQVAPPLEDQLSSDSVGGGSGLLDLTREGDDTSLGAEILDQIDMEGAIGSSIAAAVDTGPAMPARVEAPAAEPVFIEEIDPVAGLFGGLILGACVIMLVLGAVMISAVAGVVPAYLQAMQENLVVVGVVALVVLGAAGGGGYAAGRSAAQRQMAILRASSLE